MADLKVNGVNIVYEEMGSGAETVVMLHSMGLNRGGMAPLAERLKDRYRVVLWDYRGMGDSEKPDTEAIGTETLYEDSVTVIKALANGPVHLIGMSMGGWIGMRIAARQPQLVRSLSAIGTSGMGADDHSKGAAFFEIIKEKGFSDPEIVEASMRVSFSPTVINDPARAADMEYWADVMRNIDPKTIAVTHSLTTRLSVMYEIRHILAPTLIVSGEHDMNHSTEQRDLQKAIPGSQLVILKNCGHTPIVEHPDEVARLVRPFLEEASERPPISIG
jgi:3-oxoadipate enol-lactonase